MVLEVEVQGQGVWLVEGSLPVTNFLLYPHLVEEARELYGGHVYKSIDFFYEGSTLIT